MVNVRYIFCCGHEAMEPSIFTYKKYTLTPPYSNERFKMTKIVGFSKLVNKLFQKIEPPWGPGVKSRTCPPYPQRVVTSTQWGGFS